MSSDRKAKSSGKNIAVVVGATSKWQSYGRNTLLAHGHFIDDKDLPRWRAMGHRRRDRAEPGTTPSAS